MTLKVQFQDTLPLQRYLSYRGPRKSMKSRRKTRCVSGAFLNGGRREQFGDLVDLHTSQALTYAFIYFTNPSQ